MEKINLPTHQWLPRVQQHRKVFKNKQLSELRKTRKGRFVSDIISNH